LIKIIAESPGVASVCRVFFLAARAAHTPYETHYRLLRYSVLLYDATSARRIREQIRRNIRFYQVEKIWNRIFFKTPASVYEGVVYDFNEESATAKL